MGNKRFSILQRMWRHWFSRACTAQIIFLCQCFFHVTKPWLAFGKFQLFRLAKKVWKESLPDKTVYSSSNMTSIFLDVVYFDQQAGALHHVSPSNELFCIFCMSLSLVPLLPTSRCIAIVLPFYLIILSAIIVLFSCIFGSFSDKSIPKKWVFWSSIKNKNNNLPLYFEFYRPPFHP